MGKAGAGFLRRAARRRRHRQYKMKTGNHKRLALTALLLSSCLLLPSPARAVPAAPGLAELTQPDGTRVMIALKGDESSKRHEDARGYTVLRDTATAAWVYAEKAADGSLRPGSYRVGAADPARLGLTPRLSDTSAAARQKAPIAAASRPARAPITSGTTRNLVILARFSDTPNTYSQAQFDALFNTAGYAVDGATGSVKDFFLEASRNALVVQSTVAPWVTLPQPYAYYGVNDAFGYDTYPKQMVIDAINALDATGFDFSPYDGDGDGFVDVLTVIHSGRGEETTGNNPNYIWSHHWSLDAAVVKDGVSMREYHTEPEMRGSDALPGSWGLTRIGVICHEFGHALGLPDLYDTGGDSSGAGRFCLMANGAWNGDVGSSPAHPSAWCKKELAWTAPVQISTAGVYNLSRAEDTGTAYLLRDGGFPAAEYFLVENRQGQGFDAGLPGTLRGALIWHIDESVADNDDQTRYKVALMQADGLEQLEAGTSNGDDSDYYRLGSNTSFSDSTTPDSKSYSGLRLNLMVWNVSASSRTMTFSLTPTGRPSINVRAWPRPWKPGSGASHDALGITFSGPPDNSVIRIYTVAGELVKELTVAPADLNLKIWDGKNSAGGNAASGVYFAHIKAPGYEAQIVKIAIER